MGLSSMFRDSALGKVAQSLNRLFTGIAKGITGDVGRIVLNASDLGAPERAGKTGPYQVSAKGEAAMERKGLPGALRANIRAELSQHMFEGAYTVEPVIRQLDNGGYRMNYWPNNEVSDNGKRQDNTFPTERRLTTINFDNNGERLDGKKPAQKTSQTRVAGLGQTA